MSAAVSNLKRSIALKGRSKSPAHCAAVSAAKKGKKLTAEHRLALSLAHTGKPLSEAHRTSLKLRPRRYGKDSPRWIADRSRLARVANARGSDHVVWANAVKRRDGHTCVLSDARCCGTLTAHHIEPYRQNQSLRYDVDNGVTLCRYHHPLKRSEEIKVASSLKAIVAKSNGLRDRFLDR